MDVQKFIDTYLCAGKRHDCFYHFTDRRNLTSIKSSGLLCTSLLRFRKVGVITGGNDWSLDADRRFGMDQFVHLCFLPSHPMEYSARKKGTIDSSKFLKIEPDVLKFPGVKFTPGVSNKSGMQIYPISKGLELLDTEVLYGWTNWKDAAVKERLKQAEKYEILVPTQIPMSLVRSWD